MRPRTSLSRTASPSSSRLSLRALAAALALVAGACGGSADSHTSVEPVDPAAAADTTMPALPAPDRPGGELVLGAEQWPDCLNPLTACSNASWLSWSVLVHLLPPLMEFDEDNNRRASPVLVEAPTRENGGVAPHGDGTVTVTYRLDPQARWSDGTPITSTDVWFTWRSALDTEGSRQATGYDLITDVAHDDPHTAVVTFSEPYAPWRQLFSRVLPAHAFDGKTDISDYWYDSIPISGGPWRQESWSSERHVLVPNENYWVADRMPLVDRVVMVPIEDSENEIEALEAGEVMALFPQPFAGAKERLGPPLALTSGAGVFIEGLWINQAAPDRRFEITTRLRQAVAYSLDRQLIADVALGTIVDDPQVLQCAGWNPDFGEWCGDQFSRYVQDMDAVEGLLVGEGWTRPDPEGLWVNEDGVELVLQWNTVAGNKRREEIQALVAEMTEPFGIGWEIINYSAGELFQQRLPVMDFGPVALYATTSDPEPSVANLYDMNGIPSEANGFSGSNYLAYSSPAATELALAIDAEIHDYIRLRLVHELGNLLADDIPWIPLYVLPNLLAWNPEMVRGPGKYVSSVYGGYYDIFDWTVVDAADAA